MLNPYKILEISENASKDDIKKAYKKLAMKHHPDKGGTEAKFKEITSAYESLINPKPSVDDIGFGGGHFNRGFGGSSFFDQDTTAFNPFDNNDIFSQFFGRGFQTNNNQNNMIQKNINVSMKDIYSGVVKNISISIDEDCKKCSKVCSSCKGKGFNTEYVTRSIGHAQIVQTAHVKCSNCTNGTINNEFSSNCPQCKNTKKIKTSKIIKIQIEPGTPDNKEYIYKDIIPNSVLKIRIKIDFIKQYYIDTKMNLNYDLNIAYIDTLFGKKYEIPHPSNTDIVLDTNTINYIVTENKPFIIYNKGLTKNTHLYVNFKIKYPSINRTINTEKKEHIKSLLLEYFNP